MDWRPQLESGLEFWTGAPEHWNGVDMLNNVQGLHQSEAEEVKFEGGGFMKVIL